MLRKNKGISINSLIAKTNNKYASPNRIEWQADTLAGRILVPSEMLYDKILEKISEYNYYFEEDKKSLVNKICKELAVYFKCSFQVMAIRINQVGMFDIKIPTNETTYITKDEALNVYNTNEKFNYLLGHKKVVYRHNRCVINNRKFINDNGITFYAYQNPEGSMLLFVKYRNNGQSNIYFLERKASVKDLADKLKNNELVKSVIDLDKIQAIVNEDSYNDLMRDKAGTTLKAIRQYKNIGIGTLAIRARVSATTITNIEDNEYSKTNMYAIAKICRCLHLPLSITHKILDKIQTNYDEYLEDKIFMAVVDNYYNEDEIAFIDRTHETPKVAEMIERANI